MRTINMRSTAQSVQGQGVSSCYVEQVKLVRDGLKDNYQVFENAHGRFDILHYHTVNLRYFFERFIKRRKSISVGYVHFLPDTIDDSLNLPWISRKAFYWYLLNFYNSMDYLVTVNPSIVKKIEDYGINRPKICFIPNFVSEDNFYDKTIDEKVKIRQKYEIEPDKFVVLGAGQLQRRKGVFDFIETAKLLPEVQFVWAGGFSFGKITDGYEPIKKIVAHPPKNVKFLGIIPREEMAEVYNLADLFFLPSFDELFPMTILEALCCKKPILLRDIEIYKEILFDAYLKADDPEGFARIISELSKAPEQTDYWREKSWKCHKLYSKETILKQWGNFYNAVYEKSTNPQAVLMEEIV